jgi:peroxiredoxin
MTCTRWNGWRYVVAVSLFLSASTWGGESSQTLVPVPGRPAAPDFNLLDVDGNQHRLADYRGKVVAINFWATWCPPCLREMPSMQRLWDQLKQKDFVILAIDVGEDDETVFRFTIALDTPLEFPLLLDLDGKIVAQWPVLGLPTTFIVDKQGRVAYRAVGGREWDHPDFSRVITALIDE